MTDLKSTPIKNLSIGQILSFLNEIDFFNIYSRCILNRIPAKDIINYIYDPYTQRTHEIKKLLEEKQNEK